MEPCPGTPTTSWGENSSVFSYNMDQYSSYQGDSSTKRNHRTAMQKCNMHLFGFHCIRDATGLNYVVPARTSAIAQTTFHHRSPMRGDIAGTPRLPFPAPTGREAFRRRHSNEKIVQSSDIMNEGYEDIRRVRSHEELESSVRESAERRNMPYKINEDEEGSEDSRSRVEERQDSSSNHLDLSGRNSPATANHEGQGDMRKNKKSSDILDEFLLTTSRSWDGEEIKEPSPSPYNNEMLQPKKRHRYLRRGGILGGNRRRI